MKLVRHVRHGGIKPPHPPPSPFAALRSQTVFRPYNYTRMDGRKGRQREQGEGVRGESGLLGPSTGSMARPPPPLKRTR